MASQFSSQFVCSYTYWRYKQNRVEIRNNQSGVEGHWNEKKHVCSLEVREFLLFQAFCYLPLGVGVLLWKPVP